MSRNGTKWLLLAVTGLVVLLAGCAGSGARADEGAAVPSATTSTQGPLRSSSLCLACHSQPGVSAEVGFGLMRPLDAVQPDRFYTSAHRDLECAECHEDQADIPHPKIAPDGRPIVKIRDASAVCESCHEKIFEGFLDSVHGILMNLKDDRGPACVDCHSLHYVQPVATWTAEAKAQACQKCHQGADAAFAGALIHREPSPHRLVVDFAATHFFGALLVAVLGIGILHTELDLLRWLTKKIRGRGS